MAKEQNNRDKTMTTPEGSIKDKIKVLLTRYNAYYFMPVQTGYGATGVDFHCVLPGGLAFFIEAKANESAPLTQRQDKLLKTWHSMGIQTFVVYDDQSIRRLHIWLERNSMWSLQIKQARLE